MAEAVNRNVSVNDGYNVTTGAQFLRWWKQQLWDCLPAQIRSAVQRSRRPMVISLADDAIWPERSDLASPYKISQTTLLSGDSNKVRPVALVVGERHGLRRKVELPLAVEAQLSQVLAYELDRLTPLRATELYYDFRVLSRDVKRNVCVVELIAAPKSRVNEMIAAAAAKGAAVNRLVLDTTDVDHGINMLQTATTDAAKKDWKRWITPGLAGLCALLAIMLVAYPIFKKRQHVIALLPLEASARSDSDAAAVVGRQFEKLRTEYNHVLNRKHASPIAVQVLEDLGKRLPDDTWAQTFEIKALVNPTAGQHPREVIVQGETGSGGKLLQLVQESTLIKDPVLKAAMTRVAPTAERFHFAAELATVVPPPGLSLTDAGATLSVPMQVMPNAPAGAPAVSAPAGAATSGAAKGSESAATAAVPAATKSSDNAASPAAQPSASTPKLPPASVDSSKKSMSPGAIALPMQNGASTTSAVTSPVGTAPPSTAPAPEKRP